MNTALMGPAFEPCERFYLLSLAIEEVAPEHAAEVLPVVTSAAMIVVRQIMGKATHAEAYAHVERARVVIMERRQTVPAPERELSTAAQ